MEIKNIRFIKSVSGGKRSGLEPLPEIALCRRSNAGKSSLLNYLAGRKNLARTGKQPGKTRLVNYFLVNDAFYLVDLPGYGYARASHEEIASWGRMMETFFADTRTLNGLIVCLDIRRDPSQQDLQMAAWADYYGVPYVAAATKADKVAKSKRRGECARISRALREGGEANPRRSRELSREAGRPRAHRADGRNAGGRLMRVFAIGDLHLSLGAPKEMDVFGPQWKNHWARIREDWQSRVGSDDVVLIPGDVSWATKLEDARIDLDAIGEMPGRKLLLRGNHDYWWASATKVRAVLPQGMDIIQNDARVIGSTVFCGARGWTFPTGKALGEEDQKIFEREKIRLGLSLEAARRLEGERRVVMMHFPPLYENWPVTDFTEMLEKHEVSDVVFGHLHGEILNQVGLRNYVKKGIRYRIVSADALDFKLLEL